jgi:LIM domain
LAGQRFTSRDDKPYCADCFGELFAKRCTACTKPITGKYPDEVTTRTELNENPARKTCLHRATFFKKSPVTMLCLTFLGIGGTRFISFEDRHWHNDCFICASCKTSLVGRGFITDEADIICPECAKQKLM